MGTRNAPLVVKGDQFRVESKSLFTTDRRQWHRTELTAILANATGIEVNNCPVAKLGTHLRTTKKVGFLAGRDEAELQSVAAQSRGVMPVSPRRQRIANAGA